MTVTAHDLRDAVVTLINAELVGQPAGENAYKRDDVRKLTSKPANYLEVSVVRRYAEQLRLDPGPDTRAFMVMIEVVAAKESNAHVLLEKAHQILDFRMLTVSAVESTPFDPQAARPVALDDREWSGLDAWNCTF